MSTVTSLLARQIERAIEAIPAAHREAPTHGDVVADPDVAFRRIQDWAFTQGYAFVIESTTDIRVRFECVHHKNNTKNCRKIEEKDRKRVNTQVRGTGCLYCLYVSRQKRRGDQWILCYSKHTEHNHPPAPDPFQLPPHRYRRPGYRQAVQIAETHRGTISFAASSNILEKLGLEIDRKAFYNLQRKETQGHLSSQDEARLILTYLEQEGLHVEVDEAYTLNPDNTKKDRHIQAIAWWSQEQMRLARRFVSRRLVESDATFNTNQRRLLLQHVVGIDNTGKTFPVLQVFHISESARTFCFIMNIWRTYFFYDCPGPAVWCCDFAAGLTAAVAQQAVKDAIAARKAEELALSKGKEDPFNIDDPLPTAPLWEADSQTIIVDWVAEVPKTVKGHDGCQIFLQRCEWHAAEAIKKKLIKTGYKKRERDELVDLIWTWIKAPDLQTLDSAREKLILRLHDDEKEYLVEYYQPKEPSFARAYTSRLSNLGIHSTQRNEKYHDVASVGLSKNIPVARAIELISERIKKLPKEYDARINKERISFPRLIDKEFFQLCIRRFTHYCLKMAMVELAQAKLMLDELEKAEKAFKFDTEIGCQLFCQLPLRFGIPCKCWMAYFYSNDLPLPPNLFDPRWLFDGPPVLYETWEMRIDNPDYSQATVFEDRYAGDRFADRGGQLIIDTAVLMAEKHKNLPPEDAVKFAFAFKEVSNTLAARQDQKLKGKEAFPPRLPEPQIQPKLKFGPGRKRALTGREIADQQEADEARARRKAERLAQEQAEIEDLLVEGALVRSQIEDQAVAAYFENTALALASQNPSDKEDDKDKWVDIDNLALDAKSLIALKAIDGGYISSDSESPRPPSPPAQVRPKRTIKPTAKQASQESQERRCAAEKESKLKKPKTKDTSQLLDLPFRSSQ